MSSRLSPGDSLAPGPFYGPCECDDPKCQIYGRMRRPDSRGRRISRDCKSQPARNQRKGRKGQDRARRRLGVTARARGKLGNEENWRHPHFRFEVKTGDQVAPIWRPYLEAELQALAAKSIGDARDFAMVAMDEHSSEGLVVVRLSTWESVVRPALEAMAT